MINPKELGDIEKKEEVEDLNERHKNQIKTIAMLHEKHKDKIESLVFEIINKLKAEYEDIDKVIVKPHHVLIFYPIDNQIQILYKANNFISYGHFIGLLTCINPEELECLDKISLDSIPNNQSSNEFEKPKKQHLIDALKKIDINKLKLMHAIVHHKKDKEVKEDKEKIEDKVLAFLEQGVEPNFSVFNVFILIYLYRNIIMDSFETECSLHGNHATLAAFANPDVLKHPVNPQKNTSMKILEALLCYGFEPSHLLYNAPGIRLTQDYEPYYEKVDLVLEALSRKSFLVDHLKEIDQTHATKLIPSLFQKVYQKLFSFSDVFIQYSSVVVQQREEISEMLATEQQKIEANPPAFGLSKFLEVTKIESMMPCRPVAALVFKYFFDSSRNVFDTLQSQKRYKFSFNGIIPPG